MASLIPVVHGAVRLTGRSVRYGSQRKIHQSSRMHAAQNFTMPAMSPTMTEGNIASWKVKEGDSYAVGDVLLEIETDKAQMEVEAQDDGILAKIIQPDGSKGVQVGARIAVLAEPGDDVASLEIPAEESPKPQETKKETKSPSPPTASPPKQESAPGDENRENAGGSPVTADSPGHGAKRAYPLYPSVIQLLHVNGISESDATKIPTTGPGGRLLKGDVLAYTGAIEKSYPKKQSEIIEKLSKLDLSTVNISSKDPAGGKASPPGQDSQRKESSETPATEPTAELSVTISLTTVTEVQQRISKTLGIDIPLAEFISRAIAISNTDLPPLNRPPTADELFNQVLGLDKVSTSSIGYFNPQILALPPRQPASGPRKAPKSDIIDILTGRTSRSAPRSRPTLTAASGGTAHVFSITVAKGDEKRAKIFLERVKTILQVDPGRLVL